MRNREVASLLVAFILAGAGLGYFVGATSQRAQTSTATAINYSFVRFTQTVTIYSNTFTSTGCSYTTFPDVLGCPRFWNQTFTIQVNYTGPWIASYQGYLGPENVSDLAVASSFYGRGMGNQSFTITGWTPGPLIAACAEAQKLDPSNSTLVISFVPIGNANNETSSAYGTARFCVGYVIG